jgi:hypothetical protein
MAYGVWRMAYNDKHKVPYIDCALKVVKGERAIPPPQVGVVNSSSCASSCLIIIINGDQDLLGPYRCR